jgi:hypothetical protein
MSGAGRTHGRRHCRGVEARIPPHRIETFCNAFMDLARRGTPEHELADKVSRAFLKPPERMSSKQLRDAIEQIVSTGRGGHAFRLWYATRHEPEIAADAATAGTPRASPAASSRLLELEQERDALVAQLRRQAEKHAGALRAARETAAQDAARALTLERNAALQKRNDAEYALKAALERAEKAEAEVAVLRRRPLVDERRLAEMRTTLDSQRGQITRLQLRLSEVERERDDKDIALRRALSQLEAHASARSTKQEASVVRLPARPASRVAETAPRDLFDLLDANVAAGVMTEAEAFDKLRRAR